MDLGIHRNTVDLALNHGLRNIEYASLNHELLIHRNTVNLALSHGLRHIDLALNHGLSNIENSLLKHGLRRFNLKHLSLIVDLEML